MQGRAPALVALAVVAGLVLSCLLPAAGVLGALAAGLRLFALVTVPGLCVVLLATPRARRDGARDLTRALALSPVLFVVASWASSAGLGLSLRSGAWLWAALASLGAVALSLSGGGARRAVGSPGGHPTSAGLSLAPAIVLCVPAVLVWVTPGARVSYHGVLHAGFVAQLVQGTVPPENPALAGVPAGFYWLYHWLLAAWGEVARVSILEASVALNLLALTLYASASVLLLRRFLQPRTAAWAGLACGFAVNLLAPWIFAVRWAMEGPPAAYVWPFEFLGMAWLGGDPRLVTLFAKFLNVNGFPLGLGLFALLLVELAPGSSSRPQPWLVVLLLVGLGLFHPTTAAGAYAALGGAVALGTVEGVSGVALERAWRRLLPIGLAFLMALGLTAPYLYSVASAAPEVVHGPRGREVGYGALGLVLSATPLLGAVLWGACRSCWRDPLGRFLLVSTTILLALGTLLPLPDGNQYKLTLMASLPGGALLFWLLGEPARRPLARVLFHGSVALAIAGHAITVVAYQRSAMAARELFAGEVGYLSLPGDPVLDRALHWLRDSTPREAVVISKPVRFGGATVRPVSARSDFVLLGGHHTRGDPRFGRRISLTRRLFDPLEPVVLVIGELRAELDRPLYVLLRREQFPEAFGALLEKFERTPAMRRVYTDRDLRIYAIGASP